MSFVKTCNDIYLDIKKDIAMLVRIVATRSSARSKSNSLDKNVWREFDIELSDTSLGEVTKEFITVCIPVYPKDTVAVIKRRIQSAIENKEYTTAFEYLEGETWKWKTSLENSLQRSE